MKTLIIVLAVVASAYCRPNDVDSLSAAGSISGTVTKSESSYSNPEKEESVSAGAGNVAVGTDKSGSAQVDVNHPDGSAVPAATKHDSRGALPTILNGVGGAVEQLTDGLSSGLGGILNGDASKGLDDIVGSALGAVDNAVDNTLLGVGKLLGGLGKGVDQILGGLVGKQGTVSQLTKGHVGGAIGSAVDGLTDGLQSIVKNTL
ncbi:hypothetical protein O0L34_g3565 [Tuta absoluta]|nr:hypothetical protein O0L34_g3565 [Tuta absoluta]